MKTVKQGFHMAGRGLAAGALFAVMSLPAQAQQTVYVGIDLQNWFFDPDNGSTLSDFGVRGKVGAKVADQISLEAHLATGGSDRDRDNSVKLDYLAGLFLRGDIPITRFTSLYGLVGFTSLKLDGNNSNSRGSNTDNSVSFGAGVDFAVTTSTSLNVDYIRYVNDSDYNFQALSVGGRWWF